MIEIDLLYFDGCPSYKQAWADLLEIITKHQLEVRVHPLNINSLDKAQQHNFAGSPSIQVNGRDLEGYTGQGVMACRVYKENNNQGWPSLNLIERQLLDAAQAG
jgi:hypothetical protein